MTLSMNAFTRNNADHAIVAPIIWDSGSFKYMYDDEVFRQLGIIDGRMLNKPGRQINYSKQTAGSFTALTEGVDIPISQLGFNDVDVQFYAYGDAVQISEEELTEGFSYVLNDVSYRFLGSAMENRDDVIIAELMGSTTTGIYPNAKTSADILATDVFNTDMIADVRTRMEVTQAKRCGAIIIHPAQGNSLVKDSQFTDASQYGSNEVIMSGEVGNYLGTRIIKSNRLQTATENGITVYKAIALGMRPFVYLPKRQMQIVAEREYARQRAITASAWEMFGVARLFDESIIVMTSAPGLTL